MTHLKVETKQLQLDTPSRKDAVVSDLFSSITSLNRAVMIHWRFLLVGIPAAVVLASTGLGHITALELCRESVGCMPVDVEVIVTAKPPFSSIEALTIIPDDFKLPFRVAFACYYLYALSAILNSLHLALGLVVSLRTKGRQNDTG